MKSDTKIVRKIFWAWQDEEEAQWLTEMANQGWLLSDYTIYRYTFVKSEPVDVVYKLDYQHLKGSEYSNYLSLFRDCGWTHISSYFGWHYFMAHVDSCKIPDIYSDYSSQVEKYKRILWLLVPLLLMLITLSVSIVFNPEHNQIGMMFIIKIAYIVLISLISFGCYTVFKKIQNLKSFI